MSLVNFKFQTCTQGVLSLGFQQSSLCRRQRYLKAYIRLETYHPPRSTAILLRNNEQNRIEASQLVLCRTTLVHIKVQIFGIIR